MIISSPMRCEQCGVEIVAPASYYMSGIDANGVQRYTCKACYIAHYRTDLAPCRYCGQNTDTRLIGWGASPIPVCGECLKKASEPVFKPADQRVVVEVHVYVHQKGENHD